MNLANIAVLRRVCMPLFRRVNPGDITVTHHWTGDPIRLHSFRHRGYWFHGKNRENRTMKLLARIVRPGDAIYDVGAHIGYLSLYLAALTGPTGYVYAFEPGPNNLPYLKRNASTAQFGNVAVVPAAVGNASATVPLYVEELSGQNNSVLPHYSVWELNACHSGLTAACDAVDVEQITLDEFSATSRLPRLVKIDVEGAELQVLHGMKCLLSEVRPFLLMEISHKRVDTLNFVRSAGYIVLDDGACPKPDHEWAVAGVTNIFAIPAEHLEAWTD